jgi:transcriptional regulator GlxA family with amidase domain
VRALIVVFDGFDELDALGPFEVLRNAEAAGADLQTELVTLGGVREITAAHGLQLRSRAPLTDEDRPDALIVPGGNWLRREQDGTRAEIRRGDLPRIIASYHQRGTVIAGVCTGAMLIAASGILRGRPAITHHQAVADLASAGAEIVQGRVVDDGDIVTAGGVTSGLDLALWLVERWAGAAIAWQVEQRMEYQRRGTVWRRTGAGYSYDLGKLASR